MSIRVLIADDHTIVRQGLRELIQKQPDMEVVAEAGDGQMAVELAQEISPDVVLMDIAMLNMNGIESTHQITSKAKTTKVIALSMYSDKHLVTRILSSGASGYLRKDCALEELAQAIRTVARGGTYLSPQVVDVVVKEHFHKRDEVNSSGVASLTAREREVLQLLVEGKTVKEIAARLYVSPRTIDTHRQQLMRKLDVHNIAGLIKIAIREGMTFPET